MSTVTSSELREFLRYSILKHFLIIDELNSKVIIKRNHSINGMWTFKFNFFIALI